MTPHVSASRPLHAAAVSTALATLVLICIGGLVTSTGAGMTVPDWPTSFGYNMFTFPVDKWVGGIFHEHTHRLVASGVGFLTLVLAVWMWVRETTGRARWVGAGCMLVLLGLLGIRSLGFFAGVGAACLVLVGVAVSRAVLEPGRLRWWGVAALAAVTLQGMLGGFRVALIQNEIGIFHASLAQLFFLLLCTLSLWTSAWWRRPGAGRIDTARLRSWSRLVLGITAAFFVSIVLAATMRHAHAGLSVLEFPLTYGRVLPDTSPAALESINAARLQRAHGATTPALIWLHWLHRTLGIAAGIAVLVACAKLPACGQVPRVMWHAASLWAALVIAQVVLGVWVITSNKAADIATLHVALGTLVLATGWVLHLCGRRVLAAAAVPATGAAIRSAAHREPQPA